MKIRIRKCDSCGKINPKRFEGNDRLCGEEACVSEEGFYRKALGVLGTNGKVGWYRLQWPLRIRWRGWFGLLLVT